MRLAALFLVACAVPGFAQLDLVLADGTPVPSTYDLGQTYAGEPVAVHFRLRNRSTTAASLTGLGISGAGFSLTAPAVPAGIPALGTFDFTAVFQASETGSYSAALHADTIVVLLTATVAPSLTYRVDNGGTLSTLTPLDFGSVVRGGTAQRRITLRNETSSILTVPPIGVQGSGFSLSGGVPTGQSLQPQQGGEFTIVFNPQGIGVLQGRLAIGSRTFTLQGVGAEPPLPRPSLDIQVQPAASAQQGRLLIRFDAPAEASGTGTATLEFAGAADPAIAFAAGGRSAAFAVAPGDTGAALAFQTGTTTGTITFTVKLGATAVQQSVAIAPAPAAITASQAMRSAGAIEIRVTGYDNTRTLGPLAFTFYDGAGKTLAALRSDAAADFARFFASSDLGGVFMLRAVFPVAGDASQAASCEVAFTNSAGTTVQRVGL
jgi:hypothetical protein